MEMRQRLILRVGLLGALAAASACSSWRIDRGTLPQNLAPRTQVEIWVAGRGTMVNAFRVVGDTLFAVPLWQSPSCDSCAISVPVSQVDSVRTRRPAQGRTIALAAFLTALLVVSAVAAEGLSHLNP